MKRSFLLVLACLLAAAGWVQAQEEGDKLNISGDLSTDNRFLYENSSPWSWNENRLDLKLQHKTGSWGKLYGDIWLRKFGTFNEPGAYYQYPELREAYIEVYDFLIPGLDLKAGRQRIKWGCADQINPVDNVNTYDFEDMWDFGRHKGNEAIKLKYYKNDWQAELVYLPFFEELRAPLGNLSAALMPEFSLPSKYSTFFPVNDTLFIPITMNLFFNEMAFVPKLPRANLGEGSSAGIRVGRRFGNYDIALSYLYGRDGLPVAKNNKLSLDSLSLTTLNTYFKSEIELIYPRMHYIGAEISGTIGNVGTWIEAAMIMPDKDYKMSTTLPDFSAALGIPLPRLSYGDTLMLEKKPWFRYVAGCDYTFANGIYINAQYAHGFVHERTSKELNDYLMLRAEKKVLNEKLRLSLISGGLSVSDWGDVGNNYAFAWVPEIGYKPNDNTEIILGTRIIDGKGGGMFARMKDYDEFFMKLTYSF